MSIIAKLLSNHYVALKEFSAIMDKLYLNGSLKIAVAVSGGSDSLCLTLLLQQWSKISNASITALIVNHGLRKDIKKEIAKVQSWLHNYNIKTEVLNVATINQASKLQQKAREARYNALLNYCEENNIAYLCVAHHFNDLIETISMRKQRKDNLWGDAGISFVKNYGKILVLRPLLFFTKTALQNTLIKLNQPWVEDPSNKNLKFERVLVRKQLGQINEEALLEQYKAIDSCRKKRIKLEQDCLDFLVNTVNICNLGVITINLEALLKLSEPVRIAVLRLLIKFCSGKSYMPKIAKIRCLLQQLQLALTKKGVQKFTIGGVILVKQKFSINSSAKSNNVLHNDVILSFIKEARIIKEEVSTTITNKSALSWDCRFLINVPEAFNKNYFFAKLSARAYNFLYNNVQFREFVKNSNLSKEIICSLPWLFNNKEPLITWVTSLLNIKNVIFFPRISLVQDLFYNFTIAKMHHLD